MTTLVLIAKETIPGRVKTRLHPHLTMEEAALIADAAIADTLDALSALRPTRRVLLFDGRQAPPGFDDWEIMPQVEGGLDERLGAMFDACDGPTVLIGMDTPQVSPEDLAPVMEPWPDGVDAWFGPANDGGFWALAMAEPDGDMVRGVPMSRSDTGAHQLLRLESRGLGVRMLPALVDADTIDDAREIAVVAPFTRFAGALRAFDRVPVH